MSDTPANAIDIKKTSAAAPADGVSTPPTPPPSDVPAAAGEPAESVPATLEPQEPYATEALSEEELAGAQAKAEALIQGKELPIESKPASKKTTVLASGEEEAIPKEDQSPPEITAIESPQEHAKTGSKALKVVGVVALMLAVGTGVGVGVWRTTLTQQSTETRSQAQEPTHSPGPILTEVSSNTTPYGISFDVYSKLYGQDVDDRWIMTDSASGATGTIYFKYDQAKDESLLFSRWDNLNVPEGTVPRLWLVKNGEYTWAGEVDFEYRQNPVVGYGKYSDSGDFRSYGSLVLSYDPYDKLALPPTRIVMSVDIQTE